MKKKTTKKQRKQNYRKFASQFERDVSEQFHKFKLPFKYESETISYTKHHKYRPDFIFYLKLVDRIIFIETKGRFTSADRTKHLLIKSQKPELDIRFIFMYNNKLSKKSETRYSDWCNKFGFKYAFKEIPPSWVKEILENI